MDSNNEWRYVLVLGGLELYGDLIREDSKGSKTMKRLKQEFPFGKDAKGVIQGIGGVDVEVLSNGVGRGTARDFISQDNIYVWTSNALYSWYVEFFFSKLI
jgi:hypothetical protein